MSDRNKEVDFDIKIENTSSNERISVNTIQEKEMISEIDIIKHKMDHFDL